MSKRRWLERGKTLLIVLLSVSAVYLLTKTPLIQDSGLLDLLSPAKKAEGNGSAVVLTAAAHPSRLAVLGETGRYGVQYDQSQVDELFARFGPLLGEGLTSSDEPEQISERKWRDHLSRMGIYFDFDRSIPLSALGSWLHGEKQSLLTGTARRILLTTQEDGQVLLCYQDGDSGLFYACVTGLDHALHLLPLVQTVEGNGAQFAFENDSLTGLLQPYTLITETGDGAIYGVSNPLSTSGEVAAMLADISFSQDSHVSVSGGDAYLDGNARLEVTDAGTAFYRGGEGGKYPVVAAKEQATLAEMIEAARGVAERTIGSRCGEARLYLESVRETETGCSVRFGYRLNGSAVWLYDEGWAAEFLIQQGEITEFTLHFRCYAATGNEALLLPMNQAAVILPELTDEARELVLQYRDWGGAEVSPLWVAD